MRVKNITKLGALKQSSQLKTKIRGINSNQVSNLAIMINGGIKINNLIKLRISFCGVISLLLAIANICWRSFTEYCCSSGRLLDEKIIAIILIG